MKRTLLFVFALLLAATISDVSAQQIVKKRVGAYIEDGNVVVAEASTTLAVELTVECESLSVGVYARYAQKYFGVRASLVDRREYRILAADVAVAEQSATSSAAVTSPSIEPQYIVPINRLSLSEKQPDEAAREAAEQVYALRQARIDLVTGEFGDGVYGAGLQAALDKIDELEQAYLELFYGKRNTTVEVVRFDIAVEADKTNYVVARFNAEEGVVAADNLAGEIVILNIQPAEMTYPASNEKGRAEYRYANNARVALSVGQTKCAERLLPIYEFGATVKYIVPAK